LRLSGFEAKGERLSLGASKSSMEPFVKHERVSKLLFHGNKRFCSCRPLGRYLSQISEEKKLALRITIILCYIILLEKNWSLNPQVQ